VRHDLRRHLEPTEEADFDKGLLRSSTLRRLWRLGSGDGFKLIESHGTALSAVDRAANQAKLMDALEALVVQFELAVPLHSSARDARARADATYLVPAYLPDDVPEDFQILWDAAGRDGRHVGVRIEFPYGAPRGFLERCLVRLIKNLRTGSGTQKRVAAWKTGLLAVGDPLLRFEMRRGTDDGTLCWIDVEARHGGGGSLARTAAWAMNSTAKLIAVELLTEWPGAIYALKVPCPSCARLPEGSAKSCWAIEEFVTTDTATTFKCDKCDADVKLADLMPPIDLVLKDLSRVKRIAAKWKMFQRHASASFRDEAKKAAAAPLPSPRPPPARPDHPRPARPAPTLQTRPARAEPEPEPEPEPGPDRPGYSYV